MGAPKVPSKSVDIIPKYIWRYFSCENFRDVRFDLTKNPTAQKVKLYQTDISLQQKIVTCTKQNVMPKRDNEREKQMCIFIWIYWNFGF